MSGAERRAAGAALVIAAAATQATSGRASSFAIAYGVFHLILARYAMAAHPVREARPECARQSVGFALAGIIWIVSAAVPAPWRCWMWGVGFGIDLLTLFASARKIPTIAAALLLGALGAGLSAVGVAGVLASAAGAQVLWNIWERAHADARNGGDPGPGLGRAHRPG